MNAQPPATPGESAQLPLPGRQFQRFTLLFHVAFLVGMILVLPARWHRGGFAWNGVEITMLLLVLAQVCCYIRFFAWPGPEAVLRERWAFYFPVSFALWFITWRIEPLFEWVVLGYLGQLFGAVRPKHSIPGAAVVFIIYLPAKLGWAGLWDMGWKQWLGYLAMIVVWSALGLFIHRLAVTSAERAKLIQELESARKALELSRAQDAELAALRERERLARELHDSLGHNLVTLTVQLEAAQRLYAVDPNRANALMEQMKALTRESMGQLRRSLAGLRAPGLGNRSLTPAIRQLCTEVSQRAGIRIDCVVPEEPQTAKLTPAIAETVWRLVQEGLANTERHSQAKSVQVTLSLQPAGNGVPDRAHLRQIQLVLADDGIGFPPAAETKTGHYGLRGLRERVEGLGGIFSTSNEAGRGAVLKASLPVHL